MRDIIPVLVSAGIWILVFGCDAARKDVVEAIENSAVDPHEAFVKDADGAGDQFKGRPPVVTGEPHYR